MTNYRINKQNPYLLKRKYGMATRADKVLQGTLKRFGLEDKFNQYRFVQFWSEIVGERIAKHAKPEMITNGILYIRVENSAWAQELSFQKEVILNSLLVAAF